MAGDLRVDRRRRARDRHHRGPSLAGSLTTEGHPTNNPESERAADARLAAFPTDPETAMTDIVVIRSEVQTVDSSQFASFVRDFVADPDHSPRPGAHVP